ncbi:multidrug MFS transporter [Candidatus Thiomargarita nelsonii]|uniref:Multidrug MFS transporter n=1 Tax=Candidatus Thiomargarita nelsonii TaxID=1003181 RepID=A0A0A6PGI9_9GAMM|nr:multidrug MFS transporter [Candidatus Thiomargarita nelsonii]
MSLLSRRLPIILHDICMVTLAWVLAFLGRYGLPLLPHVEAVFWQVLPIVIIVQSIVLWYGGLYRSIWRFTSMPDLSTILQGAIIGTLAIVLVLVLFNRIELVPRTSLLFYPCLLIFLLGMPRLLYRLWYEHSFKLLFKRQTGPQRVLVLGAGTSGDMLVRDMLRNYTCGYLPVAFLDDQVRLHGGKVQGVPVLGSIDKLSEFVKSLPVDVIVIAMPAATDEQMRRVVEYCERCTVPVRTLPKLDNLVNGQVSISALHDVAIEDLLGRAKIQLDWQIIEAGLRNKVVMVSGGGGSIGAELCRQIAGLNPTALVIVERCEYNLYQVEMQLRQDFPDLLLYAHLGDIVDAVAVYSILEHYHPEVIFHAAAYKHVPMLQSQVREAVRNNVLGTKIMAEAAAAQACEIFVLISTDKAVNPTNIMGATKRAAEIFCQAMNGRSATRFITVRFGNVLGSAGSVVPLFKAQIAKGGPLTVTDPEVSRYFMTIPEACQLILQAGAMGQGGEIFVLDMGKAIKIIYLAEQMIRLSGNVPEKDIGIVYTRLRPGEKLHEELFHADEKLCQTSHAKILLADHRTNDWDQLSDTLKQLVKACDNYVESDIKKVLKAIVPELNETSY